MEIPVDFKTTDGINYDEEGINLGTWIRSQRQIYQGKKDWKGTLERKKLLDKIGMRFDNIDLMENWINKYNLAKKYYEYHGNLNIPQKFKTINGVDYDENGVNLGKWICSLKESYKGYGTCEITPDKIKLLEDIGIVWMKDNIDDRLQSEEITEKNINKKHIEILNRTRTLLNQYQQQFLPSKDEINQGMLDELNHTSKSK